MWFLKIFTDVAFESTEIILTESQSCESVCFGLGLLFSAVM